RELAPSLQCRPAPCSPRLQGTGPRGDRASSRRMAGSATPTSSAGHATRGAPTNPKLTLTPDHSSGADHEPGCAAQFSKGCSQLINAFVSEHFDPLPEPYRTFFLECIKLVKTG